MYRKIAFTLLIFMAVAMNAMAKGFYSNRPAKTWEEYLVSGNGTMGLMVAGNPYHEALVVNHTSLFMPCNPPSTPPSQGNHLDSIRSMMLRGEYEKASKFLVDLSHADGFGKKRQSDLFVPAFQLNIVSDSMKTLSYQRSVDFMTGEVKVAWSDKKGNYERRSFVSRTDNVIVTEIKATKGKLNLAIDMGRVTFFDPKRKTKFGLGDNLGVKSFTTTYSTDSIVLNAEFEKHWRGGLVGYDGMASLRHEGGNVTVKDDKVIVRNARKVMLIMMAEPVTSLSVTSDLLFSDRMKAVEGKDYEALLTPHAAVQSDLMSRVSLDLNADEKQRALSSEELLKLGGGNKAVIEHLFDAARYNIISCCALPGQMSQLPLDMQGGLPNLQGIWGATMTPPWAGDYTTNGNLPTAVSHLLSASTPDLMLALFRKLESQMEDYRTDARVLFGCRGIHIPSHIQLHGYDNQFDATWPMTFWTAGAAWYSLFYYDYYLYTKDEKFLMDHALPFMTEATLFYEDFLVADSTGQLMFNPSYSPENNPTNSKSQACINATMDIAVCKVLLRDMISVSESHNINKDKVTLWKSMLARLPKYEVNKQGELREWTWQNLEDNHQHRHASHLIGMYYRKDPEIMQSDTLCMGVLNAVKQRLAYRKSESGVMAFGLSQLCFPACLLGYSDLAGEMLTMAGNTYFNNNLMTTHDPHQIFNTDMSGAYPEMVMMMLAYSDEGIIDLLPALPVTWHAGTFRGMSLRGGIHMDFLTWKDGKVEAQFTSKCDQTVTVTLKNANPQVVTLKAGKSTKVVF